MIKRTIYFGNPAYLSLNNEQLIIKLPEVEKNNDLTESFKQNAQASIPVEDVGIIVLDHKQITITQALIAKLLDNNAAIISCDDSHHPVGLLMPLCGNKLQTEKFRAQIDASVPLKKQLWQQTVVAKIKNQAILLKTRNVNVDNMFYWAESVLSGDNSNHEARAAAYYWNNLFDKSLWFTRERNGNPPNNLLNYGYAILRAIVARSLVASGLLPTLGIHHRNKYNAYCLADDIMEPYRPYVDKLVLEIVESGENYSVLNTNLKKKFLEIPAMDIRIDGENSPLMVGMQRTTSSLSKCFEGEVRKIIYPELIC